MLGASWELHSGRFWGLFHEKSEITDSSNGFSSLISVQLSSSVMSDISNSCPWTAARQASLSITNSQSLLKLMSIKSVMPSNHLILCRLLLLPPSILPSIGVFSNKSVLCITWPKYWSFSFSISPPNEYSELISFRMDWLDLLAVQVSLKSLLQRHSSAFSFLYSPTLTSIHDTGKTMTLTRWTLLAK